MKQQNRNYHRSFLPKLQITSSGGPHVVYLLQTHWQSVNNGSHSQQNSVLCWIFWIFLRCPLASTSICKMTKLCPLLSKINTQSSSAAVENFNFQGFYFLHSRRPVLPPCYIYRRIWSYFLQTSSCSDSKWTGASYTHNIHYNFQTNPL